MGTKHDAVRHSRYKQVRRALRHALRAAERRSIARALERAAEPEPECICDPGLIFHGCPVCDPTGNRH